MLLLYQRCLLLKLMLDRWLLWWLLLLSWLSLFLSDPSELLLRWLLHHVLDRR
jgi:hypothetical protein